MGVGYTVFSCGGVGAVGGVVGAHAGCLGLGGVVGAGSFKLVAEQWVGAWYAVAVSIEERVSRAETAVAGQGSFM